MLKLTNLFKGFSPRNAMIAFVAMFASAAALAITAPAVGSLGYDLYDIFVLQGIQGAPGFLGGVIGIAYSATMMNSGNWKLPALGVLGSSALIRADDITTTLGMII
ncbi:hypothetical protein [Alteromonas macleodii]|uniref:ABC transporter permease n=1 Tax=Alteromonas macleodii TaxID=28108 RepID=A0AB36FN10_ALTMA|nr:hypothetical protein [Alteromonas macleodii]OES24211.1 hypothetical protein BFV93_4811 [Alteromonas macleodii]OES24842.1 hypothetical protein BFV95_4601 [Alteromonas macleodii]OES25120.1 hypothetical protein BFV94_4591 [Alteromonas macleodii]OES39163.1 hypothetical protein BFV96_4311 [Alteromonas macleodii]